MIVVPLTDVLFDNVVLGINLLVHCTTTNSGELYKLWSCTVDFRIVNYCQILYIIGSIKDMPAHVVSHSSTVLLNFV